MLYHSTSNFAQRSQISELGDYEELFRSPGSSSADATNNKSVLRPPIEPSPLSLGGASKGLYSANNNNNNDNSHPISPDVYRLSTFPVAGGTCTAGSAPGGLKTDTRDAALLLTSLKKLAVKEEETMDLSRMSLPNVPSLKLKGVPIRKNASFSKLCSAYEGTFEQRNSDGSEGANGIRNTPAITAAVATATAATSSSTMRVRDFKTRARAVSVDSHSHHFAPIYLENDCVASFRTDALPREKICLDLTLDQKGSAGAGVGNPAHVSPPTSPVLESYKASKQLKGPLGLLSNKANGSNSKKRQISQLKVTAVAGIEPMQKKKKQRARPSILRAKEIKQDAEEKEKGNNTNASNNSSKTKKNSTDANKKILRKKFSWKSYPELESFLIANREEYLRHSAMNYTMQQKEYNNRLTERLLELASECGYVFDEESFSFVSIRDRIRCYFKSYVQSKKKRGLILGYAARRKGLITEAELEKSAGIKGTIVVPKKSVQKKTKASSSLL
mmetsp:Transcript_18186/g.27283  ORF Transcript_18186/g.27283 Transcript_18186/m.27283 type:complete len:502 (-) Transcript_18186:216-1721(-)